MLPAILNHSWRQFPAKQQLYSHLPPISKTTQISRTRHAGHCWKSKDELISGVLLWTPSHGGVSVGRPIRTYLPQLCTDTGCSQKDPPEAINDRDEWWERERERERVREIRASNGTFWWCWLLINSLFHHHHQVVLTARIPLALSCHLSLSAIALGRSSALHIVFAQNWNM